MDHGPRRQSNRTLGTDKIISTSLRGVALKGLKLSLSPSLEVTNERSRLMETAPVTETTRRIILGQDIPEPAVSGLAEFTDRYYIRSKTRFIEPLSYRKTISGIGLELFWILRPTGPEQPTPLPVSLKISQVAVELDFPGLDPNDKPLEKVVGRTVDEIETYHCQKNFYRKPYEPLSHVHSSQLRPVLHYRSLHRLRLDQCPTRSPHLFRQDCLQTW